MQLTLFYDATCPLCVAEMDLLRRYDKQDALCLQDIHAPDFNAKYPQVDVAAANQILHGLTNDGKMLYGLDVTVSAWRLVGKKKWLGVLRWPVIRWFADKAYLYFARNRYRISGLLTGSNYCSPQQPSDKTGLRQGTAKNCTRSVNEDAEF